MLNFYIFNCCISMYYVYLLRSISNPKKTYIGYTLSVVDRLQRHNAGGSVHTKKDKPWELVAYVAFDSPEKAIAFEKYLKSGSGHAFAKKRFWL